MKKEKGNFYTRRKEWEKAMNGYNQALKLIQAEEASEQKPRVLRLRICIMKAHLVKSKND